MVNRQQAQSNPQRLAATTTTSPATERKGNGNHKHHTPTVTADKTTAEPSPAVTFKADASQWLMTVTNHHGKTRTLSFSDPDGDGSFAPIQPDLLTGQSTTGTTTAATGGGNSATRHAHPHPHGHGKTASLSVDGASLVLTETNRVGSMVMTFKDDDLDGIFTKVSSVFRPLAGSTAAVAESLNQGLG